MFRAPALVAALALALSGCAALGPVVLPMGGPAAPVAVPADAADQPTPAAEGDPEPSSFGRAHPAFTRHFTDPLYADEADEFAPFGNDEGWDTLAEWSDRRAELTDCSTVRQLLEDSGVGTDHLERDGPDVDGFVIGAGLGLIYLTGRIDPEGKQLTLDALHRTYSSYADENPRQQPVMIRDLASFPARDTCPR
jgi:predicted small lipoprotein YifL